MSGNVTLRGACPAPFYDASFFSKTGGYQDGRFCSSTLGPECCLPCPATEWIYPESFNGLSTAAAWLNVVGFIVLVFLLISYAVLPAQMTNKHYLNICLIVSCVMLNLGFIIPFASKSDQCYDEITSNDMYSDNACAFGGAFILMGGVSAAFWVCLRAASMFLQIVWGIEPGKKSFYLYQAIGWVIPAALVTAALVVTGVSYRFGSACHINHEHALADFWGWILAVAGITIVIQGITMVYCLKVYLTNLFASDDEDEEDIEPDLTPTSFNEKPGMSPMSPTPTSEREMVPPKVTAREVYQQVKTVLYVQWRILFLTITMLIEVIFFSVIFVLLDSDTTRVRDDSTIAQDWLTCLVYNPDNRAACLKDTHSWMVDYSAVSAVLMMLSLIGVSVFVLLFRIPILTAWREWFGRNVIHRKKFVTVGKPHSPQIRHLGVVSPSESTRSHAPLAPGYQGPGNGQFVSPSPLSAAATAQEGSPYSPSTPKLAQGSDFYDVSAYRARPTGDAPGSGRYWHPNPNVQAAQREGIMRTLRMARARAQNAMQGQSQNRYPFGARSPQSGQQEDVAELPPDTSKEYYAR